MTQTSWAPIALFVYKRAGHARRMIEHLQRCTGFEDSPVYVFADGPKVPGDLPAIQETRSEARRLLGDRAVFHESAVNLGVDKSEIAAITELCNRYGKVVVVEDDLIVSPNFLQFLNEGLVRYENEPRVMEICGYIFDVPELRQSRDAIFLPLSSAWGWATWKRAWDLFDLSASGWSERLADTQERRRFNVYGNFDYAKLLAGQMRKPIPAWDIVWYYTVFSRNGLALHPPQTLVLNEGFDGTGTHIRLSLPPRQGNLSTGPVLNFPSEVEVTEHVESVFKAIGAFRTASRRQKLRALAKTAFGLRGRP
jgi:hypothetical protein